MVELKRLHQNRAFSLKCSCFGCEGKALAYYCCGWSGPEAKKMVTTKVSTLNVVKDAFACSVPMCRKHVRIMNEYIKEISLN